MAAGTRTTGTAPPSGGTVATVAPGRRAAPLSAPERRAAIISATLPLLRQHGLAVTTRQIASAAGVAEGTIFSVFDDKEALLRAAMETAFDHGPVSEELATIDLGLPLATRLVVAVEVIQRHMASIWELVSAPGLRAVLHKGGKGPKGGPARLLDSADLAQLFEPDRSSLRRPPDAAAQLLLGLILAGSHPAFTGDSPLSAEEIVSVLLDGIRNGSPS